MKKNIGCCLICLLFFSVSVAGAETIEKTLSLGQYAIAGTMMKAGLGQFVAYDGRCATLKTVDNYDAVVVRVCGKTTLWLVNRIVEVKYDGNSVVHITYQE